MKDQYLILLNDLGVKCGLHKSILSPKGLGLEFAKKTLLRGGVEISPLPLKEFFASLDNISAFYNFALKHKLSRSRIMRVLGFGYKVVGVANNAPFRTLNRTAKSFYLMSYSKLELDENILFSGLKNLPKDIASSPEVQELLLRELKEVSQRLWKVVLQINQEQWSSFNWSLLPKTSFELSRATLFILNTYRLSTVMVPVRELIEDLKKAQAILNMAQDYPNIRRCLNAVQEALKYIVRTSIETMMLKQRVTPNLRGISPFQIRM